MLVVVLVLVLMEVVVVVFVEVTVVVLLAVVVDEYLLTARRLVQQEHHRERKGLLPKLWALLCSEKVPAPGGRLYLVLTPKVVSNSAVHGLYSMESAVSGTHGKRSSMSSVWKTM